MRNMKIAYVGKDYTLRQLRSSQDRERNQTDDRGDGFGYIKLVEGIWQEEQLRRPTKVEETGGGLWDRERCRTRPGPWSSFGFDAGEKSMWPVHHSWHWQAHIWSSLFTAKSQQTKLGNKLDDNHPILFIFS